MDSTRLTAVDAGDLDRTLEHYGVKGMRWGVRKDRRGGNSSGGPAQSIKKAAPRKAEAGSNGRGPSKDSKSGRITEAPETHKPRPPKRVSDMSDDELRRILSRIDMERRISKLLDENDAITAQPAKKEKSRARKTVEDVLYEVASKQAKDILNAYVSKKAGDVFPGLDLGGGKKKKK